MNHDNFIFYPSIGFNDFRKLCKRIKYLIMKYWETEHSIPLAWHEVACGYWWRYPNPHSQHVFSVDTLDTRLEGDKLYARRLIMKTNPLPSWGKHFFNARKVAVIEEVEVDRDNHKLVWYTRNIGLQKFMATVERATLTKNSDEDTTVHKECWIESSIVGFRSAIKHFGVERYKSNCGPATRGFQMVVEENLKKQREASSGIRSKDVCSISNTSNSGLNIYNSVTRWQCEAEEMVPSD